MREGQTFSEIAAAIAPVISGLELPQNTSLGESNQGEESNQNFFQGAVAFMACNENVFLGILALAILFMLVCTAQIAFLRRSKNGDSGDN